MSRRKPNHEYGQAWMTAAALLRGPRTEIEIREHLLKMIRRFGFVPELLKRRRDTDAHLRRELERLVERDWAFLCGLLW